MYASVPIILVGNCTRYGKKAGGSLSLTMVGLQGATRAVGDEQQTIYFGQLWASLGS